MATQIERRAASTQALLDASRVLVAQGGFARASVQEIGTTAGLSRGAVNFYYGSKANLLVALLEDTATQWATRARAHEHGHLSALDELDAHLRWWLANPLNSRLLLLLIYEGFGPSHELRQPLEALQVELGEYLKRRLAAYLSDAPKLAARWQRLLLPALLGLIAQQVLEGSKALPGYDDLRAALGQPD